MPPWQGGGEMILSVTFGKTIYNEIPHKFEAGTPNIASGISWAAGVEYLEGIGLDAVAAHENDLLEYGTEALLSIPGLQLIGTAVHKAAFMFVPTDIHPPRHLEPHRIRGSRCRNGPHCAHGRDRFESPPRPGPRPASTTRATRSTPSFAAYTR